MMILRMTINGFLTDDPHHTDVNKFQMLANALPMLVLNLCKNTLEHMIIFAVFYHNFMQLV